MMEASRCLIMFSHLALLFPVVRVNRSLKRKPLDHRTRCVCASNIISCSNANITDATIHLPEYTAVSDLSFNHITELRATWTSINLSKLQTLSSNNNGITFLSSEAFVHVTKLRHSDLSSNALTLSDEFIFEPSEHLEVLSLFKNRISQIDRSAFSTMGASQKLYLSHNQISRFPLEVLMERSKEGTFKSSDVSSNKIKALPMQELQAMRAWLKNGVYFHSNTSTCSCESYNSVASWHLRKLWPVSHFAEKHTCNLSAKQNVKISSSNCSEVKTSEKVAYSEQKSVLDCDTKEKYMAKTWVSPGNRSRNNSDDGYSTIGPLNLEDSGVYTCTAINGSLTEVIHITVMVSNSTKRGGSEDLKTAYTTSGACLISLVLISVYLYVTPSCCTFCSGGNTEKDNPGDSLHSSIASLPSAQEERGAEAGVFPFRHGASHQSRDQNERLNPVGEED